VPGWGQPSARSGSQLAAWEVESSVSLGDDPRRLWVAEGALSIWVGSLLSVVYYSKKSSSTRFSTKASSSCTPTLCSTSNFAKAGPSIRMIRAATLSA